MDPIDMASDHEQMERDSYIRRSMGKASLIAIGRCYFCDAGLNANYRFCDEECRDGYEVEQRAMTRNGQH